MNAAALSDIHALVQPVIAIARRAGAEILEVYEGGGDVDTTRKADESPLTIADLRSHHAILAGLRELTPTVPVLSEESADIAFEQRSQWTAYWLVDPLDGTKEFLSRNGEFTVNIALIIGHEPVLGVVYVPVRDTVYWGVPGLGAYRARGAGPDLRIVAQSQAAAPVRVVGSKSHRGDSLDAYLAVLGPHELMPIGSSLKLCLVAEGAADLYPRLGPTCEWDTAAAQAVVVAAGGTVVTTQGEMLAYNTKPDLLNPYFMVYADRSKDWLFGLRS